MSGIARAPGRDPATRSSCLRYIAGSGTAWATKHKVELCFTPTYASWADPIEAHFGPLRQFTIANSNYPNHAVQTRALHAYLRWRNTNARHRATSWPPNARNARASAARRASAGADAPSRSQPELGGPCVTFARTGGASRRSGWARPPGGTGRAAHRGTPRVAVRTRALPARPPHAGCRRGRHQGTAGWW